jgi:hypothetical protein
MRLPWELELISGAKSLAEVCRHYQLNPQMVARWKAEFLEKAPLLFQTGEQDTQERARIADQSSNQDDQDRGTASAPCQEAGVSAC